MKLDFSLGGRHQIRRLRIGPVGDEFDWWRVIAPRAQRILGSGFDRDEAVANAIRELEKQR